MADKKRHLKPAGNRWKLTLSARPGEFRAGPDEVSNRIDAADVLAQATAALWLLTHYGGVGAKGRKGFGSLADVEIDGLAKVEDCIRLAQKLRSKLGHVLIERYWTSCDFLINVL
jgi:CRISPR-associated protein Cmr6